MNKAQLITQRVRLGITRLSFQDILSGEFVMGK